MTQPPAPGPWPSVENRIDGTVTGHAVQAGAIYGGVHYHATPPVLQPYVLPSGRPREPAWPVVGRWFVALLPLMLGTAAIGAAVDAAAAGAPIAVRVLLDLIVLALVVPGTILWSALSGRGFTSLLRLLLDKATPRPLAASSPRALWAVAAGAAFVGLSGFVREVLEIGPGGTNGALLFFLLLAVLAGRLVVRRLG